MAKMKYYVVWEGISPGIYNSWPACQKQVAGYKDAKYKSYDSQAAAEQAFREGWRKHWGQGDTVNKAAASKSGKANPPQSSMENIDYDSLSVDVGTRGNPGPVEYKGVDTRSGEILFYVGPIENGTNNLGEFIAVVHALAYLKERGSSKTVYTDSRTALSWIKNKRIASSLVRNEQTRRIWELADRALEWLHSNQYSNKIKKWETNSWGEIKADFGRK